MPIHRHPSPIRANFTILRNATIEDARLSWEARGLLIYLLSKPDNWVVSTKHLIKESPTAKKEKVLKILTELESFGYLKTVQGRDAETGSFEQVTRIVYDTPSDIIPDEPADGFTGSGDTGSGDTGSGKTDRIVRTDLEQELNVTKTEVSSLLNPSGLSDASPKPKPYENEFEELWALYPRRVGKAKAYTKLVALLRSGTPLSEIKLAPTHYARLRQGQDNNYTLHAATFWGPGERWKDYLPNGEALVESEENVPSRQSKGMNAIQAFLNRGGH